MIRLYGVIFTFRLFSNTVSAERGETTGKSYVQIPTLVKTSAHSIHVQNNAFTFGFFSELRACHRRARSVQIIVFMMTVLRVRYYYITANEYNKQVTIL